MRTKFAAEDVPQDVFVQTWEMAALYVPSRCKPMPWAIMLTRNNAIELAFFSSLT